MGCTSIKKTDHVSTKEANQEELKILNRVLELMHKSSPSISQAELEFVRTTFLRLQSVEESRRGFWLNAIQNDIIAPLYYSINNQYVYSEEVPFLPDPLKLLELQNKDFNLFAYEKPMLREKLLYIFSGFAISHMFELVNLQRFFYAVSENYQENPFHNFYHGFAVCQMIHVISYRTNGLSNYIGEGERLALYLSALGHDLNHPGVTNQFIINSRHNLAVRYNDLSVLENHHAATLIHFLELEGCNFLVNMSPGERTGLRKQIIPTVLATDMARHSEVMSNFSGVCEAYDKDNAQHKQFTIDLLLHAADVGNPTLKFDLATVWSLRIIQEFNEQVLEEERRGLPVSEFLRVGTEIERIKKNQIGFIDAIILPLWQLVGSAVDNIEDFIECIQTNKENWRKIENLDNKT